MLPIKLTMHYFGPYQSETIDFRQLTDTPVFLVSGNTGSGKTTIFDAMCYALFGQTTNDQDRDASAMRSDFAPRNQETSVTFTFSHKGQKYQITRKPAQNLLGKRGRMVAHTTKVSLIYPLDSENPLEITKIKEADEEIERLLNMTRDQFKQIVLLPQGKFRQFLVSSSSEKEALLRDLFNTSLYEQWGQELKDRLTQEQKQQQALQTKLTTLKERVTEVDSNLAPEDWIQELTDLIDKRHHQVASISREINSQQSQVNDLIQQEQAQQTLIANLAERKQNIAKLQQLQSQSNAMAHFQKQIDQLSWYQHHQQSYFKYQNLLFAVDDYRKQIAQEQTEQSQIQGQQAKLADVAKKLSAEEATIAEVRQHASVLTNQLPQYTQKTQLMGEIHQQKATVDQQLKQVDQATNQVTALHQHLEENQKELDQCEDLTKQQVQLTADRHRLQDIQQLIKDYQAKQQQKNQLTDHIQQAQEQLKSQEQAVVQAQHRYADLKDALARSEIANLVHELKPGSPCPICGSTEHPHPAEVSSTQRVVSKAEVEAANQEVSTAKEQLTATRSRLEEWQPQSQQLQTQLTQQLKQLNQELKTSGDFDIICQQAQQLNDQVTENQVKIEHDQKRQQELREKQKQLQAQQDQTKRQLESSQQQVQSAKLILTQKQTALQTIVDHLTGNFADEKDARQQLTIWQRQINHFTDSQAANEEEVHQLQKRLAASQQVMQNAQTKLKTTQHERDHAKEQLVAALNDYSADLEWSFWQWAGDHVDQLDGLQKQVTDYHNHLNQVQTTIQHLDEKIADQKKPDLQATQSRLHAMQDVVAKLQEQQGQLKSQLTSLHKMLDAVTKLYHEQNAQLDKITDLQTISDVMNGNTESKLSLERYVLQSYLTDVLHVANERLNQLTNGRYAFVLSNDQAKGRGTKWSGLEINVYDDNAGQERSARTLSGGESFIASLALALGLGEVIQERSGGIQVDALFVDEGFGSLDQEALNQALNSLQSIKGYQMIGIISHVTELENQVPTQLQVISQNAVSHVRYQHEIGTI